MPEYIKAKEIFEVDIKNVLSDVKILKLLEVASRHIGEVNNIVSNVLEYDFIIAALKNIESLNSARIEGTTGNLKDLYLENALDFEKKKQLKLFSAINYKMTMGGLENIIKSHKKIDLSLIQHLHKKLTENDPATKGTPGKFREKEVIIQNSKLGNFFPAFPNKIDEFMNSFISQIEEKFEYPSLLQAAFTHYQFESIHPFEDGNGRTGRLLIVAQLLINKTIDSAVLNLSQYFDKYRDEYIASLRSVSDKLDYSAWIIFFLNAIIEQSKHNMELVKNLRDIKEKNEIVINEKAHSPAALQVLNHSLNLLYITTPDTELFLKKKGLKGDLRQMARNNIKKLEGLGILEKTSRKIGKSEVYVHCELKNKLTGNNSN